MISGAATVDEFLAGLTAEERVVFAQLRAAFKASSRVVESMEYRMPTYKIGAEPVGALNRQKNYLCLYADPVAVKKHRKDLGKLSCGKSCIRFNKPGDLPLPVAKRIIKEAIAMASR